VVFPETAIDRALDICRKMRDAVSSTPFVGDGMQVSLTASFGLASLRGAPKDVKRLAERLLHTSQTGCDSSYLTPNARIYVRRLDAISAGRLALI